MSRKIKALHRYITDECRRGKGDDAVRGEVDREVTGTVAELLESWPAGDGAVIHVEVSVEYPSG